MIYNNVHYYRKKRKLTQIDLAKAVDVTSRTIISLEKGNYVPSLLLAFKLSRFLEVDINDLFYLGDTDFE